MELLGYISDEMYVAIADAQIEFRIKDKTNYVKDAFVFKSAPSGAIYGTLPDGNYQVAISCSGYGSKITSYQKDSNSQPVQFRLLSKKLSGYIWPKWSRAGEKAEIRFSSHEVVDASLWRLGWKAEKIREIGRFEPFAPAGDSQTLPDGDISQSGVGWNHERFQFPPDLDARTLIAPEQSGLYYIQLKSLSGEIFTFPWIVAPKAPVSKVALLASNICWNAYNDWGGRSNYVAADKLPQAPAISVSQESPWFRPTGAIWWVNNEFEPLSFDRPEPINNIDLNSAITDPILKIGSEHLVGGEWRLFGWMEREGIEYDFYAENQFDDGTLNLSDYKVLVLSTHPEYWTINMYKKLKAWVANGGRLLYLGGNGINCSVELGDDAMKVFNMDLSDWLPHRAYSGDGALIPSRFGLRHENESSLLGVVMSFAGMGTGAPYEVLDADHPIFSGTGLKNGDHFGFQTLAIRCPGGASGHETDKMDSKTPENTKLLARGTNGPGAGAELVSYTTPNRGLVISVGSVNWGAGLPIDETLSKITRNMFDLALGD
jgi:hypothetical protein